MISLSDAARKELDAFFSGNPDAKKSVRVFPAPGGCCGPTLSMALDDADDNDVSEEIGGVTYCMTKGTLRSHWQHQRGSQLPRLRHCIRAPRS